MRPIRLILIVLGLLITSAIVSEPASAAAWEKLIMPGPVIEDHAESEAECSVCHSTFSKEEQNSLCLECHEDVQVDLADGGGFHGRHPDISSAQCSLCHADHLGRDADILSLVPESFAHDLTDFPLTGVHTSVTCAECHDPAEKHREAPSNCHSCHETEDSHRGGLGIECGSCHDPESWSSVTFDHTETADYELTGGHLNQQCESCHIDQRFEDTSDACVECHQADDVHSGERGNDCANCHTSESWTESSFDHLRETEFALEGTHTELDCVNCHLSNMSLETPPSDCSGCHSSDDVHRGQRGTDCAQCHQAEQWAFDFDHEGETGFALLGTHKTLECTNCHTDQLSDPLPVTCEECHGDDDPHTGSLGACDGCHNNDAWSPEVAFDHEFTRFPLVGLHLAAACEQCHVSLRFDETESDCVSCHGVEDPHYGNFGTACSDCHNPGGWDLWSFDHDVQTAFALDGTHQNLTCDACHSKNTGVAENLSQSCGNCHLQDDAHGGQFGNRCARCHTTTSFSDDLMFR